jgi:GntR family transcriptional regulator of arabinose operon
MPTGSILKKDQVYHKLRELIHMGKLAANSKLPRETDFATELEVSRITLRASLNRLEQEGFIKRVQGRGTFVSPQTKQPTSHGTIIVVHNTESGFESAWHYIVPEISRFANEHQFKTFITTNTAFEMFSENEIKTFAAKNNVIGIIATINHFNGDEPIIAKLKAAAVPIVLAHAGLKDHAVTGFSSIAVEEKNGWETAIRHLTEQGHSNIAIIGSDSSNKNAFRDNDRAATLKQLAACGANPNPNLIIQTHFDKTKIQNAVATLLKASPKPTAFLCYSDFYAIYVYEMLGNLKLRIPKDIAVMGICGFPDAQLLSPPLSTIDYNYAEYAEMAVDMILKPKPWFDPKTGKGKLRMKPFTLKARKSTKQQPKEVTIERAYHIPQVENAVFA